MTIRRSVVAALVAVLPLVGLGLAGPSSARSTTFRPSCASASPGQASCLSQFRTSARTVSPRPPGLGPDDIASAYGLSAAPAPRSTVAIVDAYDNPNAESDLAVYRRTYGLPACTTANGCFAKVNQRGATTALPDGDQGWGVEIALDLDAVSAACPTCHILLVEADDPLIANLGAAVDTAVQLGATAVSNSYGTDESPSNATDALHWTHPGTSVVASTGDYGFTTASFPAALGTTIAVGGTSLTKSGSRWSSTAWSGAGSGCSAYVAKPSWQKDTRCGKRTVTDVSAVADPDTGLAVYDTYLPADQSGFLVGGGTSLSSPLVAAMIARSGRPLPDARWIYAHRSSFTDVVGGSTGYCGGDYLCTGLPGYDSPTGVGSPKGVGGL